MLAIFKCVCKVYVRNKVLCDDIFFETHTQGDPCVWAKYLIMFYPLLFYNTNLLRYLVDPQVGPK